MVKQFLSDHAESAYANFNRKFITSKHPILGVRIPLLRKFAKEIEPKDIDLQSNTLSHEEILLYGFSTGMKCKTEEEQLENLTRLLPHIDNWATCDCIVPSLKKLNGEKSYKFFTRLLFDSREFYVRAGIIGLMRNFLRTKKLEEIMQNIKQISSKDYYVQMAIAWLNAELATFNFPRALKAIEETEDTFVRNKSISKARDSFRLTAPQKSELLRLKK